MPNDDLLYFSHMLDAARGALAAMEHVTRSQFDADENFQYSIVWEVITRDLPGP